MGRVKVMIPAPIDEYLIEDKELVPSWGKGLFNHLGLQTSKYWPIFLEMLFLLYLLLVLDGQAIKVSPV